jgi:hypothetical protein
LPKKRSRDDGGRVLSIGASSTKLVRCHRAATGAILSPNLKTEASRLRAGPRVETDKEQAFFAIFEALNWAAAIDHRVGTTLGTGERWASSYAEGSYALGFRYARNVVHHEWADALFADLSGFVIPSPLPARLFEWRWRIALPSTRERGRAEYEAHLAGQPVRFTLEALESLYAKVLADL